MYQYLLYRNVVLASVKICNPMEVFGICILFFEPMCYGPFFPHDFFKVLNFIKFKQQ